MASAVRPSIRLFVCWGVGLFVCLFIILFLFFKIYLLGLRVGLITLYGCVDVLPQRYALVLIENVRNPQDFNQC